MPQFSIRYCSNSLDTNSSKSGFFVNFWQVYRYLICNEINCRSLLLWGFDNCEKKEPSKELNRICMLESCNFALWKSLNHRMVLVKKLVDSLQCIKVRSTESEFGRKERVSSLIRLYFFNSFLVGIILCRTLKENGLSLLSLDDLYISTKHLFQSVSSGKHLFQGSTASFQ